MEPSPSNIVYTRSVSSVSAKLERSLLSKLVVRLPAFVTPNMLTVLGVVGGAMTGLGYALGTYSRWWLLLAILGFFVHWFGDSLDGTLARFRKIERPRFGMFIDQSADLLTLALILIGLGLSPWVRFDVALATYTGYLLLAVLVHLRAGVTGLYDIAHGGIGPTEGRMIMIGLTIAKITVPPEDMSDWAGFSPFDLFLLFMVGWACLTCVVEVIRTGRQLGRDDRPGKAN